MQPVSPSSPAPRQPTLASQEVSAAPPGSMSVLDQTVGIYVGEKEVANSMRFALG